MTGTTNDSMTVVGIVLLTDSSTQAYRVANCGETQYMCCQATLNW